MKSRRDRGVVKQQLDYSCGAAALATLLRFQLGDPVTEQEILADLLTPLRGEEEQVRIRDGFSFLDLQTVARARGYAAQGYRLRPHYLRELKGPVIVYFEPRGYDHFAVLKGIRGDRVFLADPSRGNIRVATHDFFASWIQSDGQGFIFVVESRGDRTPLAPADRLLAIPSAQGRRPELLSAREMLAVGNPLTRIGAAGAPR